MHNLFIFHLIAVLSRKMQYFSHILWRSLTKTTRIKLIISQFTATSRPINYINWSEPPYIVQTVWKTVPLDPSGSQLSEYIYFMYVILNGLNFTAIFLAQCWILKYFHILLLYLFGKYTKNTLLRPLGLWKILSMTRVKGYYIKILNLKNNKNKL